MANEAHTHIDDVPDDAMLFSYGYGGGSVNDLRLYAEALDATVVDTRISPRSRNPDWRKSNLEQKLGSRYVHEKSCGNKNYKGGPVRILDSGDCVNSLVDRLDDGPVILLCYCPEPRKCHRSKVARMVREATGDMVYHLPTRDHPDQGVLL